MAKTTKEKYKVTLEVLGEKWKAEGSTVERALGNIKVGWEKIMGKGIITVSKGGKRMEYMTNAFKLRKIFANKVVRASQARNLEHLLEVGKKTNIPR